MSRNTKQTMTKHACRERGCIAAISCPGPFASSAGFTMIELLMVIVIMAIAAAVVVPMASSAASMQLRSAANMVAADLEYAKSMSISRGQWHSVVFDPTNEAYRIVGDDGVTVIPHPVKQGFDYVMNFQSESRLSRVDILSANFDGSSTVRFDYFGSPQGGLGPLNSGAITLRAGDAERTVNVEPVTGFISVSD